MEKGEEEGDEEESGGRDGVGLWLGGGAIKWE